LPLPADLQRYVEPAVLYSFITGFVVYVALAKGGLQPKVIETLWPVVGSGDAPQSVS
jgi:hypothetical protein